MTAQQCAERQAARDNLVQELIGAVEWLLEVIPMDPVMQSARTYAAEVLFRAKDQA